MKKNFIKKNKGEKIIFIVASILFIIYALSLIYPFVWLFLSALKDNDEFFSNNALKLPANWLFENFITAFSTLKVGKTTLLGMTFNSVWFAFGAAGINMLVSCMSAYVVSRYSFKINKLIYGITIFIMMVPIVGSMPSQFKMLSAMKIINTPMILLTFTNGFNFAFIVLFSFYKNLPWSYAEAAFIDGAGNHKVFWKIMLPLAMGPIFAIGIINAIALWNDYSFPLVYLKDYSTLASGLYLYEQSMIRRSNYPVFFAGILISLVPIMIIFLCFQNTIMQNTYAGGLKG